MFLKLYHNVTPQKDKCTTDDNRFNGCPVEFDIFKIICSPPKLPNVDRIVVLTKCSSFFGGYGLHLLWNFWAMGFSLWVQDLYNCIDALGYIHTLKELKGSVCSTSMLDVAITTSGRLICQNQERTLSRSYGSSELDPLHYRREGLHIQVLMVGISFWSALKVYGLSSRN